MIQPIKSIVSLNTASIIGIFGITLTIFLMAPVSYVTYDTKYSMMVSQSLIEYGSPKLDNYEIPLVTVQRPGQTIQKYPYQFREINGHFYYFFPPGTSVLSTPFVAVMNLVGISVFSPDGSYDYQSEVVIQHTLAAFLMAVLAGIFFMTARCFLPLGWSWLIALTSSFGTSILSMATRALWSHTWSIFLLGIVIYLLVKLEREQQPINPILLASLLSWMYFVRPTNSISIIVITGYLFWYHRTFLVRYMLTGLTWFALFVGYSLYHFETFLPTYFLPTRLSSAQTFLIPFTTNLLSPSRGLFIFSPFLLMVAVLIWRYFRHLKEYTGLLLFSFLLILIHAYILSRFPVWWAGHSYGYRFMTDIVPWLVLLSILSLYALRTDWHKNNPTTLAISVLFFNLKKGFILTFGAILITFSFLVHFRGAFSWETAWWNDAYPLSINQNAPRVWDWQAPQFLAGLQECVKTTTQFESPVYELGKQIKFSSPAVNHYLLKAWHPADPQYRWTERECAQIRFKLKEIQSLVFKIKLASFLTQGLYETQLIKLRFNDQVLTTFTTKGTSPAIYAVTLPASLVQHQNTLALIPQMPPFWTPKTGQGKIPYKKRLGIEVEWFQLDPIL
jgi:hypothetical protein